MNQKNMKAGRVHVHQGPVSIRFNRDLEAAAQNIALVQDTGAADPTTVRVLAKQFKADVHVNMCKSYSPSRKAAELKAFGSDKFIVLPNYTDTLCASGETGVRYRGNSCLDCPLFNYDLHPRFANREVADSNADFAAATNKALDVFEGKTPAAIVQATPFIPIPEWW